MKILISMLCATLLVGCAPMAPLDKTIPIGGPAKFNTDPDRYDHKVVYVRAYIATSPHWWQFFLYEGRRRSDSNNCLSFLRNDWIMDNRDVLDRHFLILKGTFLKGVTANSLFSGCILNDNGFVPDEDFLRKRYGDRYRP